MDNRFKRLFDLADRVFESQIMESFMHEKAEMPEDEVRSEYSFAVPGKDKNDISVKRKRNKLFIEIDNDLKKTLMIPRSADVENIKVKVAKGVLTIKFERDVGGEAQELEID